MNKDVFVITTNEQFKVFADPYRMEIIDIYIDKSVPLTVKMVADILGEVPAKVHYHVQKLLKIGVLELDHIKVINGINAKYYKLTKTSFKFDIQNNTSPKMKNFQVESTIQALCKPLNLFKETIVKHGEKVKKEKHDLNGERENEGYVTHRHLYLTQAEYEDFQNMVYAYVRKYNKVREGTNKYDFLSGLFIMEKKEEK